MSVLKSQWGFTMPMVLAVMLVGMLLGVVALSAASGETPTSGTSRDRKLAYAAAEAGVNWYSAKLNADNAYWQKCAVGKNGNGTLPVYDYFNRYKADGSATGATDTRTAWRSVPDTDDRSQYAIELLPAGYTGTNSPPKCDPTDAATATTSMIDSVGGSFRIRSTGRYNGVSRSLIATFRPARFLDFVYLTTYETTDPQNYDADTFYGSGSSRTTDAAWAATRCADRLRTDRPSTGLPSNNNAGCGDIQFLSGDGIAGPLHSDDSLLTCGTPTFGRRASDTIETSADPSYIRKTNSDCAGNPVFKGTLKPGQKTVQFPGTSGDIATSATGNYALTGTNFVTLNGSSNTVTIRKCTLVCINGSLLGGTTVPWPANGLIYATQSGTCSNPKAPRAQDYSEEAGCANVYVSGTYAKDITIASQKDVIVTGDLTQVAGSDAIAGLQADQFVRVYNPVNRGSNNDRCYSPSASIDLLLGGTSTAVSPKLTIEAAVLALNHSFTVDNFDCSTKPDTLTVKGAIAQKYRGAVGTSGYRNNSYYTTGFLKNYGYDDRLKYRTPPFFLSPENPGWRLQQMTEQVPAT